MSQSLRTLGLLGFAFVGLWCSVASPPTPPVADGPETVGRPLAHENLCVYPVYGPDTIAGANVMTLQEALERDLAVVHETSDVNTLAVENRSPDCELFIQSGDIVKGGKQDRMIATDVLVPPGAGRVPLPAHCVERGRWTNRGAEDAKLFKKSDAFAAGSGLKYANARGQQSAVWQTVSDNQGKLRTNVAANVIENASPTSLQLTIEAPAVRAKVAEYEAALQTAGRRGNVVGVVFVVNGQITGAEVYGSNALFRKAWPKLLNAAAVEAVADRTDAPAAQPPTARAIDRFLARGAEPEPVDATPGTDAPRPRPGNFNGARGVNQEEEVFQTEGRPRLMAAQRPQARTGQLISGEIMNSDIGLNDNIQTGVGQPVVLPVAPVRAGGIAITGNERTGDRVQTNPLGVRPGQPAPPAGSNGNRLDTNCTENRSTLVVESRDPARQSTVIHRSYIKK